MERKANRFERYAARFAAKEAGMKAIGTGWRHGRALAGFEVANLPSGKPTLRFHGVAAEFADRLRSPHRFPIDYSYRRVGDGTRDSGGLGTARSCASSSRLASCQV